MLKLFYAPQSRASTTLWLLEELEQPYELELVELSAPDGVPESYRATQPHKKVPALLHDDAVITERAAIAIYLADRFPEKGLAPAVSDPARGRYLTWVVYCDSVLDPAIAAKLQGWQYAPSSISFGTFEDMHANVERTLTRRPYIAGDTFTAADVQLGSAVFWARHTLGLFEQPVFDDYLARLAARPGFQRYAKLSA
jgi:glutathione S-transferase